MNRRTRVLHVFGTLTYGGAELRTLEVASRLKSEGFEFEFVALSGQKGTLDDRFRDQGFAVHYLKRGPRFPGRFIELLKARSIDIVHSHVHYFSGLVLALARRGGIPGRIAHFRSMADGKDGWPHRTIYRNVMQNLVRRHATHVVAVSSSVATAALGSSANDRSRVQTIFNGIDLDEFRLVRDRSAVRRDLGMAESDLLIIHVGAYRRAKNHVRVVGIFSEIFKIVDQARLRLIGRSTGSVGGIQLSELIGRLEDPDRIEALGELPRPLIVDILMAADLMLFPSLHEGLPGAVLEACAVDLPVLGSSIPPIEEIATLFPNVHTLALQETDTNWAERALAIVGDHRRLSRDGSLERFSRTPFDLEASLEQFRRLWRSIDGSHS